MSIKHTLTNINVDNDEKNQVYEVLYDLRLILQSLEICHLLFVFKILLLSVSLCVCPHEFVCTTRMHVRLLSIPRNYSDRLWIPQNYRRR